MRRLAEQHEARIADRDQQASRSRPVSSRRVTLAKPAARLVVSRTAAPSR